MKWSTCELSSGAILCCVTQENIDNLERTHKSFCKIVLRENYISYENALYKLNMESLQERRQILALKFAKSGIKYDKLKDLLPINENLCKMENGKLPIQKD